MKRKWFGKKLKLTKRRKKEKREKGKGSEDQRKLRCCS